MIGILNFFKVSKNSHNTVQLYCTAGFIIVDDNKTAYQLKTM